MLSRFSFSSFSYELKYSSSSKDAKFEYKLSFNRPLQHESIILKFPCSVCLAACLDDVRLDGHPLPLPPNLKVTQWGVVTFEQGIVGGCEASTSCNNVSCPVPLQCRDAWRSHYCGSVHMMGRLLISLQSFCYLTCGNSSARGRYVQ